MTASNIQQCPHCNALNPIAGDFCQSCGKALPGSASAAPRVVGGKEYATTAAGQKLQLAELAMQARRASRIFIGVGAVILFFGGAQYSEQQNLPPLQRVAWLVTLSMVQMAFGAMLLASGLWAKRNPLPATIVGFLLYVGLTVAYIILYAQAGLLQVIGSVLIIRLFIMVVLLRAVAAGIRHRKLSQALSEPLPMARTST